MLSVNWQCFGMCGLEANVGGLVVCLLLVLDNFIRLLSDVKVGIVVVLSEVGAVVG